MTKKFTKLFPLNYCRGSILIFCWFLALIFSNWFESPKIKTKRSKKLQLRKIKHKTWIPITNQYKIITLLILFFLKIYLFYPRIQRIIISFTIKILFLTVVLITPLIALKLVFLKQYLKQYEAWFAKCIIIRRRILFWSNFLKGKVKWSE